MARTKSKPKQSITSREIRTPGRNRRRSSKGFPGSITYQVLTPHQLNEQYYLGNIPLGITNNVLPEAWNECRVVFTPKEDSEDWILKMFFDVDNVLLANISDNSDFIKDLFKSNTFAFRFYADCEYLIAQLYLRHMPLLKFTPSIGNMLKMVFANVLEIEIASNDADMKQTDSIDPDHLAEFYKTIKQVRDRDFTKPEPSDVQHPLLKPLLRPYQQDAVRWMLLREQFPKSKEMLHPLFQEIKLDTGAILYFNRHTGYVDNIKPVVSSLRTGGILADEMGLGKTVEVLACILLSPKPSDTSLNSSTSSEAPTVIKSKKRSFDLIQDTTCVNKSKKIKISDEFVKPSSRKSATRLCLEMWYNSKLEDVYVKKVKSSSAENEVYCICGNNDMNQNAVQCIDCYKHQHGPCLGYKDSLGKYRCPSCWTEQPLLESKATLIVCPASLQAQWCEEICKHISSGLKIFVYEGSKASPIYPTDLLHYDVVITTYTILQSELRLSENTKVPSLRYVRRYSAQGSPLSRINWWRLCLDEAQMVEVPRSMMSTMAKKLSAQHRWAVTGTPITREISGLYGLIDYLQLEPYNEYETWKYMLYLPYISGTADPMLNFLAQVLWRCSKAEVVHQIGIPSQTVIEYPLQFTAVESFFYQKEHGISASDFKFNIKRAQIDQNIPMKSVDRTVFNFIMAPLLNIRRACNSANSARGRYLVTRKQVTSIKDLLDALLTKNMNFCEENLRLLVSSLNGLAGINLLVDDPVGAVKEYRKVLRLAALYNTDDTKKGLAVDKLQLIHTMHNLAEVLETAPPVEPTLRDSSLRKDCLQLQEKYLEKFVNECLSTFEESETTSSTIIRLQEKYIFSPGLWYTSLMEWIAVNDLFGDLAQRILNAASNANIQKLSRFSDERDLVYLISVWHDEIINLRLKTYDFLGKMYSYQNNKLHISEDLVQSAMDCHLRPQNKSKSSKVICLVCKVSRHMRKYEAKLFEMTQIDSNEDEDISNKGSWKPTWAELVFRVLLTLAKTRNADKAIINDGEIYVSILDAMKREFKQKRKFWTYLHRQINALDEISMCKIRIHFKMPGESKKESTTDKILKQLSSVLSNPTEFINYIEPHELNFQASVLRNEELRVTAELEKNLGTFKYLDTLRCQQYAGQKPDPCPICKNELQEHWSIFPCGHSYCLDCIDILMKRAIIKNNVTCSICRQTHRALDISYIRTNSESDLSSSEVRIKGDYSTKIEAIVKLIIRLKYENNNVKILVFSTWVDILSMIHAALIINGLSSELPLGSKFNNSVKNFKNPSKNLTVLLLPIHLGSKGLNLTEATHVILVEPLLNPGDELQAIGRVHRIGQTKPTTVHKFIIQNTIEENIHKAIARSAVTWDSNKYTLGQLIDLFVTNESSPIAVDDTEEL